MTNLTLMQDPTRWPNWPVLPVTRGSGMESLESRNQGLILDTMSEDGGAYPTVYHKNMFQPNLTWTAILEGPQTAYPSWEALLKDGWRVD